VALPYQKAVLLFGIVNAALFSALLPLWEGFDEAFHYGYVEALWQTLRLPVLGATKIPYDVAASLQLAPVSHVLTVSIPEATSYDAWFALPGDQRAQRRRDLELLTPEPRSSSRPNYEAHQPPLAYTLLAPLDWSMARLPLIVRVLVLRLFCALCSVMLLFFGAAALCRELQAPEPFATTALFTIFCSEMLYATTAHVANDWLAVGVSAFFLAALAGFVRKSDRRSALRVAAWLSAGLLTKAYFLIFAVLTAGIVVLLVWRNRSSLRMVFGGAALVLVTASPWYLRNVVLYGNLAGTHEAFDGIGVRQALAAAPQIDWVATSGFLARASLWTGNNWFNSYSSVTLDIMLGLLALGMAAWAMKRRAVQPAELAIFAAILLFSAGVAYASCASFADRGAGVAGASPWYTQVLLAPVIALVFLGLSRWKRIGAGVAAVTVALWGWVLVATWTVKLFPMYSGGGAAVRRWRDVWDWYTRSAAAHSRDLSLSALAPAAWLYVGLLISIALTAVLGVLLIRGVLYRWNEEEHRLPLRSRFS
jgi:hypothetical protein